MASFGRLLPTVLKNRCQGVVNYRLAPLPVQSNVQMLRILIHLFAEEKWSQGLSLHNREGKALHFKEETTTQTYFQ